MDRCKTLFNNVCNYFRSKKYNGVIEDGVKKSTTLDKEERVHQLEITQQKML